MYILFSSCLAFRLRLKQSYKYETLNEERCNYLDIYLTFRGFVYCVKSRYGSNGFQSLPPFMF